MAISGLRPSDAAEKSDTIKVSASKPHTKWILNVKATKCKFETFRGIVNPSSESHVILQTK